MTGECGNLVRELGFEDYMMESKWPVKHGVVVSGTRGNPDWWLPMTKRNPDLTADFNPTWQVRRSSSTRCCSIPPWPAARTDQGQGNRAARRGRGGAGAEVEVDGGTDPIEEAPLDCSGQATFLANRKATGPKYMGSYDKQIAIFSHIKNFVRDEDTDQADVKSTNTHIFYTRKYHWAWGIPVDHEVRAWGSSCQPRTSAVGSRRRTSSREMRELNPGLAAQDRRRVGRRRSRHPQLLLPGARLPGPGYICVGDSHRFVDPIFSFGLYVPSRSRALEAAMPYLEAGGVANGDGNGNGKNPFIDYMITQEKGIDVLEDMIDTFWENPLAFAVMVHNKYREPMLDVFSGRIYEHSLHLGVTRRWWRSASCSSVSGATTIRLCSRSRSGRASTPSGLRCGTPRSTRSRPRNVGSVTSTLREHIRTTLRNRAELVRGAMETSGRIRAAVSGPIMGAAVLVVPSTGRAAAPDAASQGDRPSTPELIPAAVAAGEITADTGNLYLTYTFGQRDDLPEPYRSDAPWEGTIVLKNLKERISTGPRSAKDEEARRIVEPESDPARVIPQGEGSGDVRLRHQQPGQQPPERPTSTSTTARSPAG